MEQSLSTLDPNLALEMRFGRGSAPDGDDDTATALGWSNKWQKRAQ
jgi:hypothetical protein